MFDKIFSQGKKERAVIDEIDGHLRLLVTACMDFHQGVKEKDRALVREVRDLEREGDTIRREIIAAIYSGAFLPFLRPELSRFVETVDQVFDDIENVANHYLDMEPPETIMPECIRVGFFNVRICEMLQISFAAMLKGDNLREKSLAIRIYEKKIDDIKFNLLREVRKIPVKRFLGRPDLGRVHRQAHVHQQRRGRCLRPPQHHRRQYALNRRTVSAMWMLSAGVFLGWSLGANDSANIFGTGVTTGTIRYRTAIALTAVFVVAGALLEGPKCMQTLTELSKLVPISAFCCALAAGITMATLTVLAIPASASQAIVGTIVGAGMFYGSADFTKLTKVVACWLFTPVCGIVLGFLLYRSCEWVLNRTVKSLTRRNMIYSGGILVAGCYGAYCLGANNVANVTGVYVGAGLLTPFNASIIGSLAHLAGGADLQPEGHVHGGQGHRPAGPVFGLRGGAGRGHDPAPVHPAGGAGVFVPGGRGRGGGSGSGGRPQDRPLAHGAQDRRGLGHDSDRCRTDRVGIPAGFGLRARIVCLRPGQ